MRNLFKLFFIMILTMSFKVVYADDITIDEIIEAFNKGSLANSYVTAGGSFIATYDEDSIDIEIDIDNVKSTVSFDLDDTVISASIDASKEEALTEGYIFIQLIDEIGVLYGYEPGDLATTVNSELVLEYTIEEEGFENTEISENVRNIQIDYGKKVPLLDFSDEYVKTEDLEKYKEYLAGDGFAGTTKGNIYIYKFGYDNEYEILVGEKENITDSSYKSILSMIEVMFDERAVSYFKENCKDLTKDISFDGFEVKINYSDPDNDDVVYLEENGYNVVFILVDKEVVLENIKDISGSNEVVTDEVVDKEGSKESQEEKDTKKEIDIEAILKDYGLYIGIGAGVLLLLILIIALSKKKKTITSVDNYETVNISMSEMGRVIRPAIFNDKAQGTIPVPQTQQMNMNQNQKVMQNQQMLQQQMQNQLRMNGGYNQQQMMNQQTNMAYNQQQMMNQQASNMGMQQNQIPVNNMINNQQMMNQNRMMNTNYNQNNYNGNNYQGRQQ